MSVNTIAQLIRLASSFDASNLFASADAVDQIVYRIAKQSIDPHKYTGAKTVCLRIKVASHLSQDSLSFEFVKNPDPAGVDQLIAYVDGKPAGYMRMGENVEFSHGAHQYTSLHIAVVEVSRELRGQGIATAMYQELKRIIPVYYPNVDSITGQITNEAGMKSRIRGLGVPHEVATMHQHLGEQLRREMMESQTPYDFATERLDYPNNIWVRHLRESVPFTQANDEDGAV